MRCDADGSTFSAPVIPSAGAVWRCCPVPCTMTSTADLLDPASAAYKKARRQFYKATKNRPAVEQDWTPFRAAEKSFKARFPPPDLSGVLDLAQLDSSRQQEIEQGVWKGSTEPFPYRRLEGCERPIYK